MISVTKKPDNTGIVLEQEYGEHFVEISVTDVMSTMDKMAAAFIELNGGNK